jgi:menaquinone-dependent protoporphyrinogen oxidase
MHARRILILYGTRYGQTAKIASRIADLLEANGDVVTRVDAREPLHDIALDAYDGVIIGASIIRGRHQRSVEDFVANHYMMLNEMPSAFLSVSGSAASPDERGRADARRCA